MNDVIIYHNPRCSKSRESLRLLRARGIEPRVIEYLKEPPDADELSRVLGMLGMQPHDLIRSREDAYLEHDVAGLKQKPTQLIQAMIEYPILIERPIVIRGNKARIGRPPEQILEIL
ncbi:TPA: arsenate reductase (glutaredoxin) [Candidatus Latescibacteria bacterium]|nr:arsenate reductase (glutaredoxin) [Candidatus Latescibacterota bacterium]|tara:strand:+ start:1554 stop:1904 length:351 start_codon:yes stop_codon:yes gene_type:complete